MIHTYLRLGHRKSFTATEKSLKCVRFNETSLYASLYMNDKGRLTEVLTTLTILSRTGLRRLGVL